MDWPQGRFHKPVISSYSAEALGVLLAAGQATQALIGVNVWPSANLAIYVPFSLAAGYPMQRLWWANGSTVAGNVDIGVYTQGGTKLISTGSTAKAGVSIVQSVAAAILLLPGSYYMAMACSAVTDPVPSSVPAALELRCMGVAQQATALPLPATFTLAAMAQAFLPVFGITSQTTI